MSQIKDIIREAWHRACRKYPDMARTLPNMDQLADWPVIALELAEMLRDERRKARKP